MASIAPSYEVRVMKMEEIPQALELWRKTEMHEGTRCLYTWMEVDPEAFWAAATKEGEVLGVCAAAIHHDDLAFIGLYVVAEQYRGFGIGIKVWTACMNHIGQRNAAVNAVPGKGTLYRDRGGFPIEELAWCNMTCVSDADVDVNLLLKKITGVQVQPVTDKLLHRIQDYDCSIHGYRRDKIVKLTTSEEDSVSVAAIKNGTCVGYGVIKLDIQGHKYVGPLYADDPNIAEVILRQLIESFTKGKGIATALTSANQVARDIAKKLGIKELEKEGRLYRKYKVEVDYSKIFAQLDLNFSPY